MSTEPQALHVAHQAGSGPRVVVAHGAMDRSVSFGRVVRLLPQMEIVRYDRRGYARSRSLGPAPFDVHVRDLLALVGDRPTVLLGHSVGGVIALAAAAQCDAAVLGVLAYEAPSPWAPWWPRPGRDDPDQDPAEQAEAFMRRMIGESLWRRLPRSIREERRAEGDALRADLAAVERTEAPYDLEAVTVPVRAVAGSDTTWYHRRAAEELATAAPDGDLVIVDGAGHGAHLSHPAALAEVVRGFVHDLT